MSKILEAIKFGFGDPALKEIEKIYRKKLSIKDDILFLKKINEKKHNPIISRIINDLEEELKKWH